MKTPPRLSIGLPVYNGEKYLSRALESLVKQDYDDFELIISDNASTDGSAEICQEFARREKRIKYFRSETNRGATWNWRRVCELAQGTYFKWAAHDDECYPAMVRRCVETLEDADPSVSLVYPWFEYIDELGNVTLQDLAPKWDHVGTTAASPHRRLAHVLGRNLFCPAIYGVSRMCHLRKTRPYGAITPDWVVTAELAMLGKIVEVPEVLFRYRRHHENCVIVNKSWRELLAWHDPSKAGKKSLLPYDCIIIMEYFRAIRALPLSPVERLLCYGTACLTPTARGLWLKVLRSSGPARRSLQSATGWRWLYPNERRA